MTKTNYPTPATCGHSPDGVSTCVDYDCTCAKGQWERDKAPKVEADPDPVAWQMVYPHQPEERPDDLVSREALLPCPFCGGEASSNGRVTYGGKPDAWWADGTPVETAYFCNCIKCGIGNQGIVGGYQTREAAIAAWNTRALPATGQDKAEVERLRAEVCAAQEANDRLSQEKQQQAKLFNVNWDELIAERDALRAQVEAMREALIFYADISKYPAPLTGGCGDLYFDCGKIARAALPLPNADKGE